MAARRKSRPPTVLAADRYRTVLEEGALQLTPEPMQQAVKARLGRIAFELGCERLEGMRRAVRAAAARLWRRRQLSITFVLVPNKLLDEPFWIRESNQMTTPNYVYIGFQA